jgi:hypothetical protein
MEEVSITSNQSYQSIKDLRQTILVMPNYRQLTSRHLNFFTIHAVFISAMTTKAKRVNIKNQILKS